MEGGQHEKKSPPSPPASRSKHDDGTAGVGRSYECIFCKRGFSTAQALGGHMNIHRRDRARVRPPPDNPAPAQVPAVASNPTFGSHPAYSSPVSKAFKNYRMHHLMPPSSSTHPLQTLEDAPMARSNNPQQLSLFGEDLHLRPSGEAGVVAGWWKREEEKRRVEDEEELDLELRLGHEP